jgi:hypothetical protein
MNISCKRSRNFGSHFAIDDAALDLGHVKPSQSAEANASIIGGRSKKAVSETT